MSSALLREISISLPPYMEMRVKSAAGRQVEGSERETKARKIETLSAVVSVASALAFALPLQPQTAKL